MRAARDVTTFKWAYIYKKSLVVCQIFNSLFQKLHSDHFGFLLYSTILHFYSHTSGEINGRKFVQLLAVLIVS